VAGGWLTGCASSTSDTASSETNQQTPIPSVEDFTTVVKPTKPIWTPWGPLDVDSLSTHGKPKQNIQTPLGEK